MPDISRLEAILLHHGHIAVTLSYSPHSNGNMLDGWRRVGYAIIRQNWQQRMRRQANDPKTAELLRLSCCITNIGTF
jgi:hypothetical protein